MRAERSAPARRDADDWDRHWEDFGELATASPAKAFRHRLVVEALAETELPERVLDIGSGSGDLAVRLQAAFPRADIVGLELSTLGVERARARLPQARFFVRDLVDAGEPEPGLEGWATHAVCSEVLEHVDSVESLLAGARPYLAPGCRLVVTVPAGPMSAFDRRIGHRRHFTVESLRDALEGAGFEVDWVHGAGFPFFNLYRLAVVSRGERLAADVSTGGRAPSPAVRAAMAGFGLLLKLGRSSGTRGWQLVASARARG